MTRFAIFPVLSLMLCLTLGCQANNQHTLNQPIGYDREGNPGPTVGMLFAEGRSLASLVEEFNNGLAIEYAPDKYLPRSGYANYLATRYGHAPLTIEEVVTALRLKPADQFDGWGLYHDEDFVFHWIEQTRSVPQSTQLRLVMDPALGPAPHPYKIVLSALVGEIVVREARNDGRVSFER